MCRHRRVRRCRGLQWCALFVLVVLVWLSLWWRWGVVGRTGRLRPLLTRSFFALHGATFRATVGRGEQSRVVREIAFVAEESGWLQVCVDVAFPSLASDILSAWLISLSSSWRKVLSSVLCGAWQTC